MSENNTNNSTLNEFISEMKTAIKDLKSLTEDVKELKKDFQDVKNDLNNIKAQYKEGSKTEDTFSDDQDVDSWIKSRQYRSKAHQARHKRHEERWKKEYRQNDIIRPLEFFTKDIGDFTGRIINTIIPNVIDNITDAIDDISEYIEDSFDGIPPLINIRVGRPHYRRVYPGQERIYGNQEDPALKDLLKYPEATKILQLLNESPKNKIDLQQTLSMTTSELLEKILKTMVELGLLIREKSGNERYLITKFGIRILQTLSQNTSMEKQDESNKDKFQSQD